MHEIFPNLLDEKEQYFVQNNINSGNIMSSNSGELDEELNVDEKNEEGTEENNPNFLGPLQRKLNKNINDLKGIFNDMNEEEC